MEGVVLSELFDLIGVEDVRDGALDLVRGAVILGHGELNDDEVPALHPEALAKFGGKEAEALLQRVQLAAWAFRIGIGGERGRPSEGNRGKIAATTLHPYAAPARREGGRARALPRARVRRDGLSRCERERIQTDDCLPGPGASTCTMFVP